MYIYGCIFLRIFIYKKSSTDCLLLLIETFGFRVSGSVSGLGFRVSGFVLRAREELLGRGPSEAENPARRAEHVHVERHARHHVWPLHLFCAVCSSDFCSGFPSSVSRVSCCVPAIMFGRCTCCAPVGVWSSGCGFGVWVFGFRFPCFVLRVSGLWGFGLGFWVLGCVFRIWCLRALGFRFSVTGG